MKKTIISTLAISSILTLSFSTYNQYKKEENYKQIRRIMKSEYNPKTLITSKLEEIKKNEQYNLMIEDKKKEIATYLSSDKYKLKSKIINLSEKLSVKINQIIPIEIEISFYSSLPCENGIYGLKTASGINLNEQTVANNFFPFFTQIYIEGYGLKEVHDTGSPKYFDTKYKFDVYIPKNQNETNSQYYKRVNNMGRKTVQAYLIMN
jgi:3D (Asp-Asp-Asp) domain-containing protein